MDQDPVIQDNKAARRMSFIRNQGPSSWRPRSVRFVNPKRKEESSFCRKDKAALKRGIWDEE